MDAISKLFGLLQEGWLYQYLPVSRWPQIMRRIFVLTFPVSIPLWLLAFPALLVLQIAGLAVLGVALLLIDLWDDDRHPPSGPRARENSR